MTVPPCSFKHGRPAVGPSCNEFVYPECWHFDNDEHGGLLRVLPLTVHLRFFAGQVGGTILNLSYTLLKSYRVGWGWGGCGGGP